jgi:DNA-binding CsgD family transcriptional regulator
MENSESGVATLTAREQHIIDLLQRGMTYEEISVECRITIGTVKQACASHFAQIGSPQ